MLNKGRTGKVGLMAPAGSWKALKAAMDNGGDSINFGVEQFSIRIAKN